MYGLAARLRGIRDDDSGFGLILTIGTAILVILLVLTAGRMGDNALSSSRHHQRFENAIDVAEAGVDQALGRLQKNSAYTACTSCALPAGGFASASAEQSWAKSTIQGLVTSQSSLLQSVNGGQYLAIRPSGGQTIYSMGWVPSQAAPRSTRLIKVQFLFGPYRPGDALLTQGDLCFSGSVLVDDADNSVAANAHTNSSLTTCSNGNGGASSITVTGDLTASGTYNVGNNANVGTGSGGNQPLETVPPIDPRYVYQNQSTAYASNWYDLCPDGTVHSPDTTNFQP